MTRLDIDYNLASSRGFLAFRLLAVRISGFWLTNTELTNATLPDRPCSAAPIQSPIVSSIHTTILP